MAQTAEQKREYFREYRKRHIQKLRAQGLKYYHRSGKSLRRAKVYGVSPEEFNHFLELQQNRCALCGSPFSKEKRDLLPAIDHCHDTGNVRGLLHVSCNRAIGQFSDDPKMLLAAVDYLECSR